MVGRRYQCEDCPEEIGYDLCGACYDRGFAGVGRFNQRHTAEHRMMKLEPAQAWRDEDGLVNWSWILNLVQVGA